MGVLGTGRRPAAARPGGPLDIIDLVRSYYPVEAAASPRIIFEPGRAITSSSQSLILRVLAIRRIVGSAQRHTDGGKNIAMPTGYEWHELLAVTGAADARDSCYNFYGPLCHPGDLHFRSKTFRTLEAGDLVAIMDAGATYSESDELLEPAMRGGDGA
jgi:diaminopimelate decarboxylase